MKKIAIPCLIVLMMHTLWTSSLRSQVAVNSDDSDPDPSAMLDVKSLNKGLLIPRMTTLERNNIPSPATGLLVYVTDDNNFYYWNGSSWILFSGGSDGDWVVSGSNMYSGVSGNVGIGTTTPQQLLHVANPSGDAGIVIECGAINKAKLGLLTNIYYGGEIGFRNWLALGTIDGAALNFTEKMRLTANGNMSIGSTTSGERLYVHSSATESEDVLRLDNDNQTVGDYIGIRFSRLDGLVNVARIAGVSESGSTSAYGLGIFTNPGSGLVHQFHFSGNGNLGIGVTDPAQKLHVAGSIIMADGNQAAGRVMISDETGKATWTDPSAVADNDWTEDADNLYRIVGNDTLVSIIDDGDVGFDITNPAQKLHIYKSNADAAIAIESGTSGRAMLGLLPGGTDGGVLGFSNYLAIGTVSDASMSLAERIRVTNDGNVGIGTSAPAGKLQVVGDEVRIGSSAAVGFATGDGDIYVSNVLELDGNLYQSGTQRMQNGVIEYVCSESGTLDAAGDITVMVPNPLYIGGDNLPFHYEVWVSVDYTSTFPHSLRGTGYLSGMGWKERGAGAGGYTTIASYYQGSVTAITPATINSIYTQFTISSSANSSPYRITVRATSGAH
ncbi:MAG: hypothetical protein JW861_12075 [Bacteroidales bacterium]|nr:hypothetical protein [Bacteroidales bacterium]